MAPDERPRTNGNVLEQLAGLTGVGWTVSTLGFLGTMIGYGNALVARLVTAPESLLYLATVFFMATLGLDRLTERLSEVEG